MLNIPLFNWLGNYEAKRKKLLKKAPYGPMKDFLSIPFPTPETRLINTPILSVDFETTGLNAKNDKLLSVGYVELNKNQIHLANHSHQIINTQGNLTANNVVIHQITDDHKAKGIELRPVIEDLLQALAGKVMLVHFARIEKLFFAQACYELYGLAPVYPIIDTLAIAKKRLDKIGAPYNPAILRLAAQRESYHLPPHFTHNALSDAVATAELFLSQINRLPQCDQLTLKSVL